MKTGNLRHWVQLAIFLITPALSVSAEVRSGYWLLQEPTADSLTRVDFSELVSSAASPIHRDTTFDTGATDCFFRNGNIVAPRGVYYDSGMSVRCDSLIAGKEIRLTYNDRFFLDSMMKRLQLSMPPGAVLTDSVATLRQCRVFFVKTRENHNAVILRVGEYIGGINRTWYYWAYRPGGGAALFKQQLCGLPDPRQLKIGVDVFSGRPNPEFVIDDSATVAAITHAAFVAVNTLFDTTLQTVGILECPNSASYRGLSVSGGFKVDNQFSDYLPTFMICSGNITLHHAEPWLSAVAPLTAKDGNARLEKLVIGYGCDRNLTTTDQYGTLRFCDLIPDSLKPAPAQNGPVRRTTGDIRNTAAALSLRGKTVYISGARHIRSIDIFNLAGVRMHSFICSGRETVALPMPYGNGRCVLISLLFADGSRSRTHKVALR